MGAKLPLKKLLVKYDEDQGKIKVARYQGEVVDLTVAQGCVTVGTEQRYVSNNLPDGTVVSCNVLEDRRTGSPSPILVRDVLKFGSQDLSAVSYRSRFELLDLLCTSHQEDGHRLFGGRCVARFVYVALPITFSLAYKCQDPRLLGVTVSDQNSFEDVLKEDAEDDDVDGLGRFPPVENESERVAAYKHMVQAAIRKMSGKWKDVRLKRHTPGQLPYSAEDLLQQGLMEVTIAIRKYNSQHASQAKESTFVYRHIWNRFGHIAHKYSKKSRGYGVHILRDFIDEDGNITTPYELGQESKSHGYLGNTDPDND